MNREINQPTKKSSMTMYSGSSDLYSHQTRIVIAEKNIAVNILNIDVINDKNKKNIEDLVSLNPYNSIPTFVDRDLVLYQSNIINEYLDERFPHPPLLPVYPVMRAKIRLMISRIEKEWYKFYYSIVNEAHNNKHESINNIKNKLISSITCLNPLFERNKYFLTDDFSLIDCCIAPLFWRLPNVGVNFNSKEHSGILKYLDKVFDRESFKESLTENEIELNGENYFDGIY